ncbi:MAG: hypothetical protein JW395_2087 [Nitrospira sp.]|nr:hypothetical protein [Nitrospira sp.]
MAALDGVVLSEKALASLLSQRDRAVSVLIEKALLRCTPGITGIVFSKDRALQLYALLQSYFANVNVPAPLYIVYGASSEGHARAYREVASELASRPVTFIDDSPGFRTTLIGVLESITTSNLFFLVDDIVFLREVDFSMLPMLNALEHVLSLRHGPHLRRSYTSNVDQAPPVFRPSGIHPELLEFSWFEQAHEWSDPWSVDGQVLSTAEVSVMAQVSGFQAPNSFESALKSFNSLAAGRQGLCFRESKILNLPLNRVQDEVPNRKGNVSADRLLDEWNRGMMLDISGFSKIIPRSPHEEHPVTFKKRDRRF